MKHFRDILKNVDFYAQNELKWEPGAKIMYSIVVNFVNMLYQTYCFMPKYIYTKY